MEKKTKRDILDCIEQGEVVQIGKFEEKYFKRLNKNFQYICRNEIPCEHRLIEDCIAYCTGNKEYEV